MIDAVRLRNAQERLKRTCGAAPQKFLFVDISKQRLYRLADGVAVKEYPVSTSRFGVGNADGSLMTPAGVHRVKEKYGHGAPVGRVFRDRFDTGETWTVGVPGENLILTRILRLEGCEDGINRGEGIDSYERYIYIHGTNNEKSVGAPASHGCVCMKNADIVELFEYVPEGMLVVID
ncbi:MAG TPA: L,D-transpeptidase [Chitinivibrionales bacterium]|jgi:lipoprotein-anchoring transpeptidase ErfK/SrfK|nr:L,D-transpeptidase [Chitinivibrionales bacterium]